MQIPVWINQPELDDDIPYRVMVVWQKNEDLNQDDVKQQNMRSWSRNIGMSTKGKNGILTCNKCPVSGVMQFSFPLNSRFLENINQHGVWGNEATTNNIK